MYACISSCCQEPEQLPHWDHRRLPQCTQDLCFMCPCTLGKRLCCGPHLLQTHPLCPLPHPLPPGTTDSPRGWSVCIRLGNEGVLSPHLQYDPRTGILGLAPHVPFAASGSGLPSSGHLHWERDLVATAGADEGAP